MYEPPRRPLLVGPLLVALVLVLLLAGGAYQMTRALPNVAAETTLAPSTALGQAPVLPFPEAGASIVAVEGLGTLGSSGPTAARPIASVVKIMTAHLILKDHPLGPGEEGPSITITPAHVERYNQMLIEDHSTLPVSAGLEFTQLELLQGLLIPSANNFAEILAEWDAGSVAAFVAKMNEEARALGMSNTTYADTSGFSAGSMSTPADQLILSRVAMQNPVFAQIVATQELDMRHVGPVSSTNDALGDNGIVGIKTGRTEAAGANLAFAARRQVAGQDIEILGGVYGQAGYAEAFAATRGIVEAVASGVQSVEVVAQGQPVAVLSPPWTDDVEVVAAEGLSLLYWPGSTLETSIEFGSFEAPMAAGSQVGWLNVRLGEQERRVPLVLGSDLEDAGVIWRLTRF